MPVHGDRELLTQLVVNLLESAIRHCPPGTEITLSIVVADDEAVATFAHNGPSIPVDERDRSPAAVSGGAWFAPSQTCTAAK
ncbi:MAG: ATP-binding protein [Hyphomicrobiales bacterium]|nr:MAG: ATP-binding protein [Hyphomicrobiales bacterium]